MGGPTSRVRTQRMVLVPPTLRDMTVPWSVPYDVVEPEDSGPHTHISPEILQEDL